MTEFTRRASGDHGPFSDETVAYLTQMYTVQLMSFVLIARPGIIAEPVTQRHTLQLRPIAAPDKGKKQPTGKKPRVAKSVG